MLLNEIIGADAETLDVLVRIAKWAQFNVVAAKRVPINNVYTEYVIDVDQPVDVVTDRQMSNMHETKEFRNKVRQVFGPRNMREQAVLAMVVNGMGRFVMHIKNAATPRLPEL